MRNASEFGSSGQHQQKAVCKLDDTVFCCLSTKEMPFVALVRDIAVSGEVNNCCSNHGQNSDKSSDKAETSRLRFLIRCHHFSSKALLASLCTWSVTTGSQTPLMRQGATRRVTGSYEKSNLLENCSDVIGSDTGCHSCGATSPGTKSGNWVPDHQPVSALNSANAPQQLYPQCLSCSREQGLAVARALRNAQGP